MVSNRRPRGPKRERKRNLEGIPLFRKRERKAKEREKKKEKKKREKTLERTRSLRLYASGRGRQLGRLIRDRPVAASSPQCVAVECPSRQQF